MTTQLNLSPHEASRLYAALRPYAGQIYRDADTGRTYRIASILHTLRMIASGPVMSTDAAAPDLSTSTEVAHDGSIGAAVIADPSAGAAFEAIEDRDEVARLLARTPLTFREHDVLTLRYGLRTGQVKTLQQIADALGLNYRTVHDIEKRALRKLRVTAGLELPPEPKPYPKRNAA